MDYNIYLHSDVKATNPTTPTNMSVNTTPSFIEDERNVNIGGGLQKVGSFLSNPDSLIGNAKSQFISNIASSGVVGAIGLVAYNIGMKVANQSVNLYTTITGDVSGQRTLNNLNSTLGIIFTPFSSTLGSISYNIQQNQQIERARLNQQLLGDSIVNQNYNRKV